MTKIDQVRRILVDAAIAAADKDPELMSDMERTALAVMAGCEIDWLDDGSRVMAKTINRIGIVRGQDGRLTVYEDKSAALPTIKIDLALL